MNKHGYFEYQMVYLLLAHEYDCDSSDMVFEYYVCLGDCFWFEWILLWVI